MKNKLKKINCFFLLVLGIFSGAILWAGEPDTLWVGRFSQGQLDLWQAKKFVGETLYSLTPMEGELVLKAVSQNNASGLIHKIQVDLDQYPFLNWKWRIETPLEGSFDEKQKSGDDYGARIYVVVSGGLAIWNTRALNYVWAKNSPKGDVWPNAFAPDNAMMVALRSAEAAPSVWHREKRKIQADFKQVFGKDIRFIDAVVIMTDTDNTGKQAIAYLSAATKNDGKSIKNGPEQ